MKFGKGNLNGWQLFGLSLLIICPLAVVICKWSSLPGSGWLMDHFALTSFSGKRESRIEYILSVPFGALVVVFFRLFMGIRLLGPFRSILLAVAFMITGILPGLVFLAIVIGIVLFIRPLIKALKLPYFARMSVALSIVSIIMLLALFAGAWLDIKSISGVVYFPIIALCLMVEGFAGTFSKEGLASALWRGIMTALVAVVITFLFEINGFRETFLYYPELLILEIGLIIVIAEFFDLRLLAWLNPSKSKRKSVAVAAVEPSIADNNAITATPCFAEPGHEQAG